MGSLVGRLASVQICGVPGAVHVDFEVMGTLRGPTLSGRVPACRGAVDIDSQGVGVLRLEGPVDLMNGRALLQAFGRADFGLQAKESVESGILPRSRGTLSVRLLTDHQPAASLNRCFALAVGAIDLGGRLLELDLFSIQPTRRAVSRGVVGKGGES